MLGNSHDHDHQSLLIIEGCIQQDESIDDAEVCSESKDLHVLYA